MRRMGIGLQLFTVRENLAKDFTGTLRRVAELGYEGVEFAGYGGLTAEALKDLLQELNLKAIGAHVSITKMKADLNKEIEYLRAIDASYLICPHIAAEDRLTPQAWRSLFAYFTEAGQQVKEKGLQFAYHNHAFEFEMKVNNQYVFDAIYASTPPEALQVELDAGWIQFAGLDSLQYIANYAGRLPLLHLKDFKGVVDGHINTVELGEGEIDLQSVIQAGSDAGVEWIIVEQDRCANPPLESVAASYNWLKRNYLSEF
ncbi:sugar phosphate isomerase/epimerase [Paenibacillus taichungensis]|uniref:sugar phosphate isomerase/epimerase family protein n=1 Tax=Paenibacillus TaxID=44249 RepID=UPI00096CDD2B|nr:sugar phosphate isomerase/epimerase [Paenibacillus taichungensis]MEC0111199.1 sugar phosphate isomerase/epimerase [Paenibacillus taichungensis]MEC0200861.1 sugar phosphate isomerase/epimerase [Paenibacillus taichungensis]OME83642.1 sugar phosphate isomerase [Paenibacillus pabuli]